MATLRLVAGSLLVAAAFSRSRIYGTTAFRNVQRSSEVDIPFSLPLGHTPTLHDERASKYHQLAKIEWSWKSKPEYLESIRFLRRRSIYHLARSDLLFGTFLERKNNEWKMNENAAFHCSVVLNSVGEKCENERGQQPKESGLEAKKRKIRSRIHAKF